MIDAITLETAHLLADALPAAHRLRYRIFVQRQQYDVPCWRGMEWDQFDTPAATYLLWRDEAACPRAVARMIPTTRPYMIQQLWPELTGMGALPCSGDVWEISRLGIDRDLEPARRCRIFGELFCAFAEFGLVHGISEYLVVTPRQVIATALDDAGVACEQLCEPRRLGRLPVVAARVPVTRHALRSLRRHHGIGTAVLREAFCPCAQAA